MTHLHRWRRTPGGASECPCGASRRPFKKEVAVADNAEQLGMYEDRNQLDHDTDMLVDGLLSELDARGVSGAAALASVRRSLKGRR